MKKYLCLAIVAIGLFAMSCNGTVKEDAAKIDSVKVEVKKDSCKQDTVKPCLDTPTSTEIKK